MRRVASSLAQATPASQAVCRPGLQGKWGFAHESCALLAPAEESGTRSRLEPCMVELNSLVMWRGSLPAQRTATPAGGTLASVVPPHAVPACAAGFKIVGPRSASALLKNE